MSSILLATSYPPPAAMFASMASVLCEFMAAGLAILGLVLCWFRSKTRISYRLAIASVVAAGVGLILVLFAELYDTSHTMDRDDVQALALWWGIPTLLAVVAFFLSRHRRHRIHDTTAA